MAKGEGMGNLLVSHQGVLVVHFAKDDKHLLHFMGHITQHMPVLLWIVVLI